MTIDRSLTPERILALLGQGEGGFDVFDQVKNTSPAQNLIAACYSANDPHMKEVLCDLLGFRLVKSAIPVLIECLDDDDSGVRGSAADALGKVCGYVWERPPERKRQQASEALLRRWDVEESNAVRSTVAQTMALVGEPAAVPLLRETIDHPNDQVRRQARWGLGRLAQEGHF